MAEKKQVLKNKDTQDTIYPVTLDELVLCNGKTMSLKDYLASIVSRIETLENSGN